MDWSVLLSRIGPTIVSILTSTVGSFGSTTAPAPVPPTIPPGTVAHPSDAIKGLQAILNTALVLNPPLIVDGWLGPKTEAASEVGIAKLKSLGIG